VRQLREEVARARVLARRAGGDTTVLDQLDLKLVINEKKRLMDGVREQRISQTGAQDMTWLAPTDYPVQAGLPPAVHPWGKPLSPSERYVSRVIGESNTWGAPDRIELDGTTFERRRTGSGEQGARASSAFGSPYRLLSGAAMGGPVAVVLPCRDDEGQALGAGGKALPPCHEPMSKEERALMQRVREIANACDRDGDHVIRSAGERACMEASMQKLREALRDSAKP
jgi:hypothetical protein